MAQKDEKDIKPAATTPVEEALQSFASLHWKLSEKKNQDKNSHELLSRIKKVDLKHAQTELKNTIHDFITIFYEAIYTSRYEFDLKISKQRQLCENELRKYKEMKLKRQKEDDRMEGRVAGTDEIEQQEEDMQALAEQRKYIKECLSTLTMLKQQCNCFLECFYHDKCLFSWENGESHHGSSNIVKSISQRFSLLKLKWTLIRIESDLVADHFWPSGEVAFVKVFYKLQIEDDEPIEILDIFQVQRKDFEVQYKMKRKKSIQVDISKRTTSGSTTGDKDNDKENQNASISAEDKKDDNAADDKTKVDSKSDVKAEGKEEKKSTEPVWEEISHPFNISTLIITRQAFSIFDVRPLYGWPEVVMNVVADVDEVAHFVQEEAEEAARKKEEDDEDDDEDGDEEAEQKQEGKEEDEEEEQEGKEVPNEDKSSDTQEVRVEGGSGEVTAIDTNTTPVEAKQ